MNDSDGADSGRASSSEIPPNFEPDKGHWYVARSVVKWPREGRKGRHLFDERLVLVDAPSPPKALKIAEKEARNTGEGHKSFGVIEFGFTDPSLGHGSEIWRSRYRTREKPEKFVKRRFESGVWHSIPSKSEGVSLLAQDDAAAPATGGLLDDWGHSEWCVVRSIYTMGRLGSRGHRYHHWTERFVLFNTDDPKVANEMATVESQDFAGATGLTVFPLWEAYWLFEEPGHKTEMFSILRESKTRGPEFFSRVWGRGTGQAWLI